MFFVFITVHIEVCWRMCQVPKCSGVNVDAWVVKFGLDSDQSASGLAGSPGWDLTPAPGMQTKKVIDSGRYNSRPFCRVSEGAWASLDKNGGERAEEEQAASARARTRSGGDSAAAALLIRRSYHASWHSIPFRVVSYSGLVSPLDRVILFSRVRPSFGNGAFRLFAVHGPPRGAFRIFRSACEPSRTFAIYTHLSPRGFPAVRSGLCEFRMIDRTCYFHTSRVLLCISNMAAD